MLSQQHWKTPENALITFIFINWCIIIHFTTNWSLGAPDASPEVMIFLSQYASQSKSIISETWNHSKRYSMQKVGNFERGKQVNGRSLDKSRGILMIDVYATESELYNFSHEYRLRLRCFAIKTSQMPSLGSKEALNVIFPWLRLKFFFLPRLRKPFFSRWRVKEWRQNHQDRHTDTKSRNRDFSWHIEHTGRPSRLVLLLALWLAAIMTFHIIR